MSNDDTDQQPKECDCGATGPICDSFIRVSGFASCYRAGCFHLEDCHAQPKAVPDAGRRHHILKCEPPYFEEVFQQRKLFEIRLNDRDYRQGDMVTLREYVSGQYTGREVGALIGFVTDFQQQEGFVVFSLDHAALERCDVPDAGKDSAAATADVCTQCHGTLKYCTHCKGNGKEPERRPAAAVTSEREQSDGPCIEHDGCPTEGAVLKRFWRAHQPSEVRALREQVAAVTGWREFDWPEGFCRRTAELIAENMKRHAKASPPPPPVSAQPVDQLRPGAMRCAKCKFRLTRINLHASTGNWSNGSSESEPCPNGCGPLWPVTWKEDCIAAEADSTKYFLELKDLRAAISAQGEQELEAFLEASRKLPSEVASVFQSVVTEASLRRFLAGRMLVSAGSNKEAGDE